MPRLGGADEVVVGEFERLDHVAEALPSCGRRAPAGSALRLTAVCFILRPCSSVPVRKNTSLPSSRSKRAMASVASAVIGVADVRRAVGIGDRRGDVEFLLPAHGGRFRSLADR